MKNFWLLGMALLAATAFLGCDNDDDDIPEFKNEFTYDGNTYALEKGYLANLGSNSNGTFDWDVTLSSSEVERSLFGISGTGEAVYLDLNTDTEMGLVAGTYEWNDSRENFSIVQGSAAYVDFDFSAFSGTSVLVSGGLVDVAINGDVYTIEFELTIPSGEKITGQYQGMLEEF